ALGPLGGHSAPRTSPDDRWAVYFSLASDEGTKIFTAPVREPPAPVSEHTAVTDGSSWDAVAEFSPDGNTLYFFSQRDGFRCHWALKLDPATKKPAGKPYPVQHYHNARRSPGYVGYGRVANAVAADKIVFTMAERTGNIWMADLGGAG